MSRVDKVLLTTSIIFLTAFPMLSIAQHLHFSLLIQYILWTLGAISLIIFIFTLPFTLT